MWSRVYRNHFIMAFPSFDTATNAWAPQADISWSGGPSRKSEFVRFPKRFMTEREAVTFALRRGQMWINRRLRHSHIGIASDRGRIVDMIGALKESLAKAAPEQPRRDQAAAKRRTESTFTFDQFKSAMAESGVHLSERTLQKSYTALVKLRKNNHLSWAQTRQKVERSQQELRAAKSPARRPRAVRIPLSERGWRNIG